MAGRVQDILFRIFYSTSFTIIFLLLISFIGVTPIDALYQSYRRRRIIDMFQVAGVYVVTAILAIFLYASRIYTSRSLLRDIPKMYMPVDQTDLPGKRIWRVIEDCKSRSAVIAYQTRPRSRRIEHEVPAAKTRIRTLLRPEHSKAEEQQDFEPDWGVIAHVGWRSPASRDLPNLEYESVVKELTDLIEARAVSLSQLASGHDFGDNPAADVTASALVLENGVAREVGGEEEKEKGIGDRGVGHNETTSALAQSRTRTSTITTNDHDLGLVNALTRPKEFGMRQYLTHLIDMDVLPDSSLTTAFIALYERARFAAAPLSDSEFQSLTRMFAEILRSMRPLVPEHQDSALTTNYNEEDAAVFEGSGQPKDDAETDTGARLRKQSSKHSVQKRHSATSVDSSLSVSPSKDGNDIRRLPPRRISEDSVPSHATDEEVDSLPARTALPSFRRTSRTSPRQSQRPFSSVQRRSTAGSVASATAGPRSSISTMSSGGAGTTPPPRRSTNRIGSLSQSQSQPQPQPQRRPQSQLQTHTEYESRHASQDDTRRRSSAQHRSRTRNSSSSPSLSSIIHHQPNPQPREPHHSKHDSGSESGSADATASTSSVVRFPTLDTDTGTDASQVDLRHRREQQQVQQGRHNTPPSPTVHFLGQDNPSGVGSDLGTDSDTYSESESGADVEHLHGRGRGRTDASARGGAETGIGLGLGLGAGAGLRSGLRRRSSA